MGAKSSDGDGALAKNTVPSSQMFQMGCRNSWNNVLVQSFLKVPIDKIKHAIMEANSPSNRTNPRLGIGDDFNG